MTWIDIIDKFVSVQFSSCFFSGHTDADLMKIKYLKKKFEDEKEAKIKQIEDEKLAKIKQILLIASLSGVGLLAILTIVIIVFFHKLKKTKGKLIEARAEVHQLNSAHKKDLQIAAGLVSEGKLVIVIVSVCFLYDKPTFVRLSDECGRRRLRGYLRK